MIPPWPSPWLYKAVTSQHWDGPAYSNDLMLLRSYDSIKCVCGWMDGGGSLQLNSSRYVLKKEMLARSCLLAKGQNIISASFIFFPG